MAAAHAQQVHADWDTMVAEFDRAMAAAPDQLIAARAAWARGEKAATSDKPAPQEIEVLLRKKSKSCMSSRRMT